MDGGTWNGKRVVTEMWIRESTTRHSGYSVEHGYGFGWHLFTLTVDGKSYREYEAQGNGGQVINVTPELDLAVMFTTWQLWRR